MADSDPVSGDDPGAVDAGRPPRRAPMRRQHRGLDPQLPPRAPALLVIGIMLAVSLVAVTPVLLLGRSDADVDAGAPEPDTAAVPMPEVLAGDIPSGDVPPAVVDAVDGPVLGAARFAELPADLDGLEMADCPPGGAFTEEPQAEFVIAGPFAVSASFVGAGNGDFGPVPAPVVPTELPAPPELTPQPGPPPPPADAQVIRATCEATWDGAGWNGSGASIGPADGGAAIGGGGFFCCDRNGLATGSIGVQVPDGVAWVLQDMGEWWTAYPVEGLEAVTIHVKTVDPSMQGGPGFLGGGGFVELGRFGGGPVASATVRFVTEDGEVVEEQVVGG